MSGGTLLNFERPGKSFGPGMVGGIIYSPEGTTAGEGAKAVKLTRSDYINIVQTLKTFKNELNIQRLERLSPENPKILLTNNTDIVDTYDLRDFIKIVPTDI
jgi:glutamate synthase domain-containing protein 3